MTQGSGRSSIHGRGLWVNEFLVDWRTTRFFICGDSWHCKKSHVTCVMIKMYPILFSCSNRETLMDGRDSSWYWRCSPLIIFILAIYWLYAKCARSCDKSFTCTVGTQVLQKVVAFSFLLLFNWRVVDLQCCVSFRYTAKWFSYTHIYINLFFFGVFSILGYYKILNIFPCAIQKVLVVYLPYI